MDYRTDLTLELTESLDDREGVQISEGTSHGVSFSKITITSQAAAERIGRPEGNYITLETLPFSDNSYETEDCFEAASEFISELLPNHGCIMVAGLGNREITPDTLGPKAADRILATRHISKELAEKCGLAPLRQTVVIAPGVLGQTGIEAAEYIRCLCRELKPSAVIVIDAMASRSMSRLGCTLQISDTGISPGAGVGNNRPRIDSEYLGTKVISLGVPTVVDMKTVVHDLCSESVAKTVSSNLIVTPREIDLLTDRAARFISKSINAALQPHIHPDELAALF